MKYELITNPWTEDFSDAKRHFLLNRGIHPKDIEKYIDATTGKDVQQYINPWQDLANVTSGIRMLANAVMENKPTLIIVDSDCDGQTSAALLLNYCHKRWPKYTESINWCIHSGKQHGLIDCIEEAKKYKFVIVPDAGTNDLEQHLVLKDLDIDVLVLDHHQADIDLNLTTACVINNQTSTYQNKQLSGVGVVWQFCKAIDSYLGGDYADEFYDLVALGLTADMMSLKDIETRALISKGFQPKQIKNPFMKTMWKKNEFKLGNYITSIGAAFYIAPFVNAMCRSGLLSEKEILFQSLLDYKAYIEVPSTKRGCKGQMETIVEQAVRTCTNVKNRQGRAVDEGLASIEEKIEKENLLDNKAIVITLAPDEVKAEIRGLVANKLMAKYQRPVCILTQVIEMKGGDMYVTDYDTIEYTETEMVVSYQGSARGYAPGGCEDFRQACLDTKVAMYATGHENAFGLGVTEANLSDFKNKLNEILKDTSTEPRYFVDYIFEDELIDPNLILDIAYLEPYFGREMDEVFVAIKDLVVTKDMVTIYKKTSNTLKIHLSCNVDIMLFNAPVELCDALTINNSNSVIMDIVGRCNRNEWMGQESAQIFIEDYDIINKVKWSFW